MSWSMSRQASGWTMRLEHFLYSWNLKVLYYCIFMTRTGIPIA